MPFRRVLSAPVGPEALLRMAASLRRAGGLAWLAADGTEGAGRRAFLGAAPDDLPLAQGTGSTSGPKKARTASSLNAPTSPWKAIRGGVECERSAIG